MTFGLYMYIGLGSIDEETVMSDVTCERTLSVTLSALSGCHCVGAAATREAGRARPQQFSAPAQTHGL